MSANEITFCTTETTTIYQGANDHGFDDDKGRAYGHRYRIWVLRTGEEVTPCEAQDTSEYVFQYRGGTDFCIGHRTAKGYQQGTPNTTAYRVEVKATRDGEDYGASHAWKECKTLEAAMAHVDKQMAAGQKRAASHKTRDMGVERPRRAVSDAPYEITFLDEFQRLECGQGFLVEASPEVPEGATVKDRR